MKKTSIIYILFGLIFLSTSCTVTKPYQAPVAETQNLYRDLHSTDTANIASLKWAEIFSYTALQELIREAISNNLDLKIAYTRVQQAQAYFEQSRLAFLPALYTDANVSYAKQSNTKSTTSNANTHLYQLSV